MPETPIDQSAGIQSIRLKIPTGTVPIPPAGFGQLHSPSPGVLAIRLPDGSVVPIGGGGGSPTTLENERGLVTVEQVGVEPQAITIYPKPGSNGQIQLAGSVIDATNQPQAPDALHLVPNVAPTVPGTGKSFYLDAFNRLHAAGGDGQVVIAHVNGARVVAGPGSAELSNANNNVAFYARSNGSFEIDCFGSDIEGDTAGNLAIFLGSGTTFRFLNLPTVDPHVAGALWIAPVTRQLMVSAG